MPSCQSGVNYLTSVGLKKKKKNYKKKVSCTNIDFVLQISLNNVGIMWTTESLTCRRWSCDRIGP